MAALTEKERMAYINAGFYFYDDCGAGGRTAVHGRALLAIIDRLVPNAVTAATDDQTTRPNIADVMRAYGWSEREIGAAMDARAVVG